MTTGEGTGSPEHAAEAAHEAGLAAHGVLSCGDGACGGGWGKRRRGSGSGSRGLSLRTKARAPAQRPNKKKAVSPPRHCLLFSWPCGTCASRSHLHTLPRCGASSSSRCAQADPSAVHAPAVLACTQPPHRRGAGSGMWRLWHVAALACGGSGPAPTPWRCSRSGMNYRRTDRRGPKTELFGSVLPIFALRTTILAQRPYANPL